MQAVVFHGKGDVRVEAFPDPVCEEGGLLARVLTCAVCGSDMKAFLCGNPRMMPPVVMGHEFCAEIVESRAPGYAAGERFVMATSVSCGECPYCRRGWPNLCEHVKPMGFGYNGGMAEFVAVPARAVANGHVVKIPAGFDPYRACLAEPVSCAVNAASNSDIRPGDTVLVEGAGPMGLINALVARAFGAKQIILSELNPERLAQGEAFGFDRLVNPAAENLADVVLSLTGGLGADVVIVAAPAAQPQEQALALVRKRGAVCLFASLPAGKSALTLDSRLIHYRELRLVGSSDSTPAEVARAIEILGRLDFPAGRLVTHRLPRSAFHPAIELMKEGKSLRICLS